MAREACFSGVTLGGFSGGEVTRMRQTHRAEGMASCVQSQARLGFQLHHFQAMILGNDLHKETAMSCCFSGLAAPQVRVVPGSK